MKKLLVVMLLAVAMIVPAFATDQSAMELDIKAGFNVMSEADIVKIGTSADLDPAFTATADFFYYVMPQLAIGAGIEYIFYSKANKNYDAKVGFTNLYAQAKYVIETGNDIFNNVYPLVQIGYGILNFDADWGDTDSNALYWGIGLGTTIKENFVFELLYSASTPSVKNSINDPSDLEYSTLQLKLGYKFSF